jgi:hypothetical protein
LESYFASLSPDTRNKMSPLYTLDLNDIVNSSDTTDSMVSAAENIMSTYSLSFNDMSSNVLEDANIADAPPSVQAFTKAALSSIVVSVSGVLHDGKCDAPRLSGCFIFPHFQTFMSRDPIVNGSVSTARFPSSFSSQHVSTLTVPSDLNRRVSSNSTAKFFLSPFLCHWLDRALNIQSMRNDSALRNCSTELFGSFFEYRSMARVGQDLPSQCLIDCGDTTVRMVWKCKDLRVEKLSTHCGASSVPTLAENVVYACAEGQEWIDGICFLKDARASVNNVDVATSASALLLLRTTVSSSHKNNSRTYRSFVKKLVEKQSPTYVQTVLVMPYGVFPTHDTVSRYIPFQNTHTTQGPIPPVVVYQVAATTAARTASTTYNTAFASATSTSIRLLQ